MATIIKIDSRSKSAKLFLEFVKTLSFAEIEEDKKTSRDLNRRLNAETEKVIADAKQGIGLSEVKDYKNLISQLIK